MTTAVRRIDTRLLLGPDDLRPTDERFEVVGAFNPGAVRFGDEVVMLVRIAERPAEPRPGFVGLPRFDASAGAPVIDWTPESELEALDPRVVRRRADGLVRLNFLSHLRVVRCDAAGRAVREVSDVVFGPGRAVEEYGVEDPRITEIDGRFYFTYVAVSRHGPATALASTVDFVHFERHGIIFCVENKDVVIFPERVGGEFAALHRPVCGTPFTRPEMWTARSSDLTHWGRHQPLRMSGGEWQSGRVGAGAPPIRVDEGWLEIYHGNRRPTVENEVGAYYGAAVLLDADDPTRVIGRSCEPILFPELDFETVGFVPNVVFPTGAVRDGDSLLVYYGAADARTAVVELSLAEVMETLATGPDSAIS